MKAGMAEFEEIIIRRLLCWEMANLRGKVQIKWNNPCAFPPVKLCRTDRRAELYGLPRYDYTKMRVVPLACNIKAWIVYKITCDRYTEDCYIPEAYVKIMDDIENGRFFKSDTSPNLRIMYTKKYEAYTGNTTFNPSPMDGRSKN